MFLVAGWCTPAWCRLESMQWWNLPSNLLLLQLTLKLGCPYNLIFHIASTFFHLLESLSAFTFFMQKWPLVNLLPSITSFPLFFQFLSVTGFRLWKIAWPVWIMRACESYVTSVILVFVISNNPFLSMTKNWLEHHYHISLYPLQLTAVLSSQKYVLHVFVLVLNATEFCSLPSQFSVDKRQCTGFPNFPRSTQSELVPLLYYQMSLCALS